MSEETAARSTAAPEGAAAAGAVPEAAARLFKGLLPEQRQVVTTLDRPVFVAAGAGSGKTFTLTRRIVWALCPGSGEGGRPYLDSLDQALVITFTEKAAGEIKERVRSALREAGLAEEALRVDAAWVSTIHHMCARILRTHALDLGLDPQFAMVGEQEARVLRRQATEDALAELDGDPGLDALFAEYSAKRASRPGSPSSSARASSVAWRRSTRASCSPTMANCGSRPRSSACVRRMRAHMWWMVLTHAASTLSASSASPASRSAERTRSLISPAAFSVKVMTRAWSRLSR